MPREEDKYKAWQVGYDSLKEEWDKNWDDEKKAGSSSRHERLQ